jgi:hypothetical protein
MSQTNKKIRIIFGVPDGDVYSKEFAAVAASMPDAECLFLAFSWSTGIYLRKLKLNCVCVPWKYRGQQIQEGLPPVAEFTVRGYSQNTIPCSFQKTFVALKSFVEFGINKFSPDVVVYGPIDQSICFLVDQAAKARSIPTIGIFKCFIPGHYFVHDLGTDWINYFKNAVITDSTARTDSKIDTTVSGRIKSSINSTGIWNMLIWIRSFERILRILGAGLTFDTLPSLSRLALSKIAPSRWFPKNKTLESLDEIKEGCVLVVLHQPALAPWDGPNWKDLILLALEATPEDLPIVIRPHPRENARPVPEEMEMTLSARGVLISRPDHGPTLTAIIQNSRAVMTLSSATGLEALQEGKPVLTLSPAFYARPGMARAVSRSDAALIRKILVNAEQFMPDRDKVNRFTSWLVKNHVIPSMLENNTTERTLSDHIACVIQRNTEN